MVLNNTLKKTCISRAPAAKYINQGLVAAFFLSAVFSTDCIANGFPVVGLLKQLPIAPEGYRVVTRPTYILTNKKLLGPTSFTGLSGVASFLSPLCCFQVKDLNPVTLEKELAKYAADPDFVPHMKAVRGYKFIYIAEPVSDRRQWTPLMSVVMAIANNPHDASPFSAPVVTANFSQNDIPRTFTVDGTQTTLSTRYDKKSERMIFTFQQGTQKIDFSELTYPH